MYLLAMADMLGEFRPRISAQSMADAFAASPGRFFAANELKAMMAYIVVNYDVKFEDDGIRPPNKWLGLTIIPDPTASVMFRKRKA